jgi:hypothetical protein
MLNPTWAGPSAKISPTTDNSPQPQSPTGVHPNSGARVTHLSNESPELRELASYNPAKKVDYLKYAKFARSLMENQTSNAATTGLQATLTPVAPTPRPKEPSPETIKAESSPASPSPRADSGDKTLPETKQAKASEPRHEPQDAKSGTLKPASPQTDSKAPNVEAGQGQTSTLAKTAPPKTRAETMTSSVKPAPMPKPRGKAGPIPKSPSPSPKVAGGTGSAIQKAQPMPKARAEDGASIGPSPTPPSPAMTGGPRIAYAKLLGRLQRHNDVSTPAIQQSIMSWGAALAKEQINSRGIESFYSMPARVLFSHKGFYPDLPADSVGAQLLGEIGKKLPDLPKFDERAFAAFVDDKVSTWLENYAGENYRLFKVMLDRGVDVSPHMANYIMDKVWDYSDANPNVPLDRALQAVLKSLI